MLSHGFLSKALSDSEVNKVKEELLEKFKFEIFNKVTYFSEINIQVPSCLDLINLNIKNKVSSLLQTNKFKLCQVELHVLLKNGDSIPHHQDNFYHCTDPKDGVKILVPLNNLNLNSGGLIYLNTNRDFKTIKHISSSIQNFSSYIPHKYIDSLNLEEKSYEYNPGDISYHFYSSIHYGLGNNSNTNIFWYIDLKILWQKNV